MADLASLVLLGAAAILALPVMVLTVQVAAAWRCRNDAASLELGVIERLADVTVAVLMPAHDEAEGIAASIASVRAQLRPTDRLLVVADNCSDRTARVAAEAGAEVVERSDPVRRGKGYALDHGVRHLAGAAPAVVVVVDADCLLEASALERLVHQCSVTNRPAQALYLMAAPPAAPMTARIAEFAWIVRNQVRPLGLRRLGLPCQLMGTGMAFPWHVIERAPLASGHIVEDLQLGLELAAIGAAPAFCPHARVTSQFPVDAAAVHAQRTRWEHGSLAVIFAMAPRLAVRAIRRSDGALATMVVDLCVPPVAALVLALVVVVLLAAGSMPFGAGGAAFGVAAGAAVVLGLALIVAWRGFAQHVIGRREWATLPLYLLAKIPLYARLFWRRQTEWVRTGRGDGRR